MGLRSAIVSGLAALAVFFSQDASAKDRFSFSLGGDYFTEVTEMGQYGGYVNELRNRFGIYTPLATNGYGYHSRASFLWGKGFGVELEHEGKARITRITGRDVAFFDTLSTSMDQLELRGELWLNGYREFMPFKDKSTVYVGLGAGVIVEHLRLGLDYISETDPETADSFVFKATGVSGGGKVFTGASLQLYKCLFLNLRSSFKFSNLMMKVEEETVHAMPLLPDKLAKNIREFDLSTSLELKF